MPVAKPSTVFTWATAPADPGDVSAPAGALQAAGYVFEDIPAHDNFNWILNLLGQWIEYINDQLPAVAANLDTTGAAVNVGDSSPPAAGYILTADDATHATWKAATAARAGIKFAKVAHVTAAAGGLSQGLSSAAWTTRKINAEVFDPDSIVAIAANQFTPIAGTYIVRFSAPAYRVNGHMARLYNATDASVVGTGSTAYSNQTTGDMTLSVGTALLTTDGTKAFEIQHKVFTSAGHVNEGGIPSNLAAEVYTQVELEKIA